MPGFIRKKDQIDVHLDTAERIRKLEVMRQSNILVPRQWRPDKAFSDAIVGHVVLSCGLAGLNGPFVGPVSHYLFAKSQEEVFYDQVAMEFYGLCQWMGVGPRINLTEVSPDDKYSWVKYTTGIAQDLRRTWYMRGLVGHLTGRHPDNWAPVARGTQDVRPGMSDVADVGGFPFAEYLPDGITPDGAIEGGSLDLPLDQYHIPPGEWISVFLSGDPLVERSNVYQTPGMLEPADCGGPPPSPEPVGGAPYTYSTGGAGIPCPNNPFSGQYASGFLTYQALFNPLNDLLAQFNPLNAPYESPNLDKSSYPGWDILAARAHRVVNELGLVPNLKAWYDAMIPNGEALQEEKHHEGWDSIPLASGWFGRCEVKVSGRNVYLRGEVTNFASQPNASRFAHWPDYLPVGSRALYGTIMRAHLDTGIPILLQLSHSNRVDGQEEHPDNIGSVLETHKPVLGSAYPPPTAVVQHLPSAPGNPGNESLAMVANRPWKIRLDGITFPGY